MGGRVVVCSLSTMIILVCRWRRRKGLCFIENQHQWEQSNSSPKVIISVFMHFEIESLVAQADWEYTVSKDDLTIPFNIRSARPYLPAASITTELPASCKPSAN